MKDFYTVSEFAAVTGKDPGNIRRNIINGKIMAEKLGKQWIIPKSAAYPEDRRLKTGIYHNQRKKTSFRGKHPDLLNALSKLSLEFENVYGSKLEEIVLYGSYARCEELPDSDVDIAVILRTSETAEEQSAMINVTVDYELELGVTLSVVTIEVANYNDWKQVLPYYKNIMKDGIILWKAA